MTTNLLTEPDFNATFAEPMRNVTAEPGEAIDIWPYVQAIPASDLQGHEVYDQFVDCVYRSADNGFDHLLVMTKSKNVYVAIVVDRQSDTVYGHWLLDINQEYGLG